MWPVVGTGIENRSASSQLDCLGCLATGVICEAVFMSSGYFCGFSNSFFSQDGERAGSYHYQQCNGISKICVATYLWNMLSLACSSSLEGCHYICFAAVSLFLHEILTGSGKGLVAFCLFCKALICY